MGHEQRQNNMKTISLLCAERMPMCLQIKRLYMYINRDESVVKHRANMTKKICTNTARAEKICST